jgi:hypothetical protein
MDKRKFFFDPLLAPVLGAVVDNDDLLGYPVVLFENRFQTREKIFLRVPTNDDDG